MANYKFSNYPNQANPEANAILAWENAGSTNSFKQTATQLRSYLNANLLHNLFPDLQGGSGTEYYHLSLAQHTLATQIANTSQNGLLSSTDWDIFSNKAEDSAVVHITGNEAIAGEKNFTTGLKIDSSALLSSVSTGTGDNDKAVTQGYVDDAIVAGGLWVRGVTTLSPFNLGDDISIGTGGLKDNDVTVAISLGDGGNTSFSTTNKTIVGSVNELNTNKANDSTVVHLTGNESIGGEKDFTTGLKINSSSLLSSVVTGVGDNNKAVTKGYVDDAIVAGNYLQRITTTLSPVNAGDDFSFDTGGLKDNDVTVAIALGDASNTSFNTTNKTIVGSVNELETDKAEDSTVVHLTGNESIGGEKDFTTGLKINSSGLISSIITGASNNDKFVTQGYVDDVVIAGGFWNRIATILSPVNVGDDVSLGTGGLQDNDVTVAIALGDASNTSFTTTNKTIVGSVNELETDKAEDSTVVHLTGNESVGGEKDFTSGIKINSSALLSSVSTGTGDNDKAVTQGYVDDAIGASLFWQRISTTLSPFNLGDDLDMGTGNLVKGLLLDKNITVGNVTTPTDITADGGGIILKGTTDKSLLWDNANDSWTSNKDFNIITGKSIKMNNTTVIEQKGSALKFTTQPLFNAYVAPSVANATGDGTTYVVIPNFEVFDSQGNYNPGTGTFIAPVAGNYLFNVSINFYNLTAFHNTGWIHLVTTSGTYRIWGGFPTADIIGEFCQAGSFIAPLPLGGSANIVVVIGSSTKTIGISGASPSYSIFSGYLLSAS